MSFPEYSKYRKSGVGWLGDLPSHWPVMQSRRLFSERKDRARDGDRQLTASQKYGIVYQDDFMRLESQKVMRVIHGADILKRVEPNDFVISMRSFEGGLEYSRLQGSISSAYVMLKPSNDTHSGFFKWLFKSRSYIQALQSTTNLVRDGQALRYGNFCLVPLPMPPIDEQNSIAMFLDRETAKIDAFIEAQRRLVELLKEKRQAVISHAVTKGIDPAVPMKNSGVEWLGDVPAHWEVVRFSHAINFQEGPGIMAVDFREAGVPLMRVAGMQGRWATLNGCNFLDSEMVAARWEHFRLQDGDVVISASASMGTVCEVGPDVAGAIPYTGLIRLKPRDGRTDRDYLRALVGSWLFFAQIDLLKTGATIQHFGPTHLARMLVTRPPRQEQRDIAVFVAAQEDRFANLVKKSRDAIALLSERRAALISAAVSGKLDVRGSDALASPKLDRKRLRLVVSATIVEALAGKPNSGRTKPHKIVYLTQVHAGVHELEGAYLRQAAGPLDVALLNEMEAELQKAGHVSIEQPKGSGNQVTYKIRGKRGNFRAELDAALGSRSNILDKLIADLGDLDTKHVEAVATLYAVWNDALLDGDMPSDEAIVSEVLNDWHPEKRLKFKTDELHTWLGWMRRHGLVPQARGPRTTTGRLFA